MKKRFPLLLAFTALFCTFSCRKEKDLHPDSNVASVPISIPDERSGEGLTVLGAKRTIPYKLDIMKQAYNNLYEPDIANLSPNYLYVRFLPQDAEDMKRLLDSGLEFWDFPLDYDLVAIGEKYHDPTLPEDAVTWQYAVAPVNSTLPDVPHEILEQLALVPEESRLAEEAFRLSGNAFIAPEQFAADPALENGTFQFLTAPPGGTGGDHGEGNGNNPVPTGPCGCTAPNSIRKPSGCVSVLDNMLNGYDGVKNVEVIAASLQIFGFVFHHTARTDYSGCWSMDHEYHGSIHLWVKWESHRCDIKTMEGPMDLEGYSFPRKAYIGEFGGPNFNNLSIQFNHTNSLNTSAFRNWVASTANNAVYEFGGLTSSSGAMGSLPDDLKILITPWDNENSGAAPMLDKLGFLQQLHIYNPINIVVGIAGLSYPALGVWLIPVAAWLESVAPDIVFNLNNSSNVNSDDIRELAYHELSHALHFQKVGDNYWANNIFYVVEHKGYGDGTAAGAGTCSVIESWGFNFGTYATDLRYGNSTSNPISFGVPITWRARLERSYAWLDGPSIAHIPFGWEWDLVDNNATNPPNEEENSDVTDLVAGFTQAQIFYKMDASIHSIPELKSALVPLMPPGVSLANYNTLAASYGY